MSQSASYIISPDHWAFSFLKPSQLLGEYTACAAKYVAHWAKPITRTISALTGTLWVQPCILNLFCESAASDKSQYRLHWPRWEHCFGLQHHMQGVFSLKAVDAIGNYSK